MKTFKQHIIERKAQVVDLITRLDSLGGNFGFNDTIIELKRRYGAVLIGKGVEAEVFAVKDSKMEYVVRVQKANEFDEGGASKWERYAVLSEKHRGQPFFPNILWYGRSDACTIGVIEYLEVDADGLDAAIAEIDDHDPPMTFDTFTDIVDDMAMNPDEHEEVELIYEVAEHIDLDINKYSEWMKIVYGPGGIRSFRDVHAGNIGRRSNGDWVVFDA